MGRIGRALLFCVGGVLLGGCTSLLAAQGDPDLGVLHAGAHRAQIEDEVGHPERIEQVGDGGYVALYIVRLGGPPNDGAGHDSLTNAGLGVGAALASGAFETAFDRFLCTGRWSRDSTAGIAVAAAVGATMWLAAETVGTVRELSRLARRRKHQLEVFYDDRNTMVAHQILPLAGGRLPKNAATVLADTSARRGYDPAAQLHSGRP